MNQQAAKKAKILKEFGANLERLIYKKFKSRDAFLDTTDIYKANLHRIINGKGEPKLTTLYRIADRLGLEVMELFPEYGEKKIPK
jgi:predicted transcriptional regulator